VRDSPADRAGIRPGDILRGIRGLDPYSLARAERILFGTPVGADVEVEVLRVGDGHLHRTWYTSSRIRTRGPNARPAVASRSAERACERIACENAVSVVALVAAVSYFRSAKGAAVIARYSRPEMAAIWSEANRLRLWQQIELEVCAARAARGDIPASDAAAIRSRQSVVIDPEKVRQREEITQHDLAAFVDVLSDAIGPAARHVHWGLTSSDVLDTGLAMQLRDSGKLLLAGLDRLREVLRERALECRDLPIVGRTHGIHAEPTTFG
jgi:hypothetical protein